MLPLMFVAVASLFLLAQGRARSLADVSAPGERCQHTVTTAPELAALLEDVNDDIVSACLEGPGCAGLCRMRPVLDVFAASATAFGACASVTRSRAQTTAALPLGEPQRGVRPAGGCQTAQARPLGVAHS